VHIEQREQQTATQLQQRVYILEQELDRNRGGSDAPTAGASSNLNGSANFSLMPGRGVIGDRRNFRVRTSEDDDAQPQSSLGSGLNFAGNLGIIAGMSNAKGPLSLSTGIIDEDMGIKFMVEHLQGEVTKLQSDNLKLRRKLKDSGVDVMEGIQKGNNVGFAFVKTREFAPAQGLGVPSVGSAPLGLGVAAGQEDTEEALDGYEKRREVERKGVTRISEEDRKNILLESGTSEESLNEEARQLNLLNWGRLESMASPTDNPLPENQRQQFRKFLYQS